MDVTKVIIDIYTSVHSRYQKPYYQYLEKTILELVLTLKQDGKDFGQKKNFRFLISTML